MTKRLKQRNMWVDESYRNMIHELKHLVSIKSKKDLSDADITHLIVTHPLFEQLKKDLLNGEAVFNIRVRMDNKRGGFK